MSGTRRKASPEFLTPPEAAALLGVGASKVLTWIERRELHASNVALNANGRPRWRIARADLDRFLESRQPAPQAPQPERRRRVTSTRYECRY